MDILKNYANRGTINPDETSRILDKQSAIAESIEENASHMRFLQGELYAIQSRLEELQQQYAAAVATDNSLRTLLNAAREELARRRTNGDTYWIATYQRGHNRQTLIIGAPDIDTARITAILQKPRAMGGLRLVDIRHAD